MACICVKDFKCKDCPHYRMDEDYGSKDCWLNFDRKHRRKKLTDEEFNAIVKLTSNTHLDSVFDVYDHGDYDCFKDWEENELIDLTTGLLWLYDGIAYPLQHDGLTQEEANLIANLFNEFDVVNNLKRLLWLVSKEEN